MNSQIKAKKFYIEKLREKVEADILLADANLKLLEKNKAKIQGQLEEIKANQEEWALRKREGEEKLTNSDALIKRMLEKDFRAEVSLRRRGGDPSLWERFGQPIYGIKFKSRNRRTVSIPKLHRDGGQELYRNEDILIVDRIDNGQAFQEWESYMEKGLDINLEWNFDKLFEEIENFLQSAPDLERYGEAYTVYEQTGEIYQPVSTGGNAER